MSIETTVFTFKISVPYEKWAAVYDSEENIGTLSKKVGSRLDRLSIKSSSK